MRRKVYALLAVIVAMILCISATASANETAALSKMTYEECIDFLEHYGVEIPEIYETKMDAVPFVLSIIAEKESNTGVTIPCVGPYLSQFADVIRSAVDQHYGI